MKLNPFEILKKYVQSGEIKDWRWEETHIHRQEEYLIGESREMIVERSRRVSDRQFHLYISVPIGSDQQGGYFGQLNELDNFEKELSAFIEKAQVSSEKLWEVDAFVENKSIASAKSYDARVLKDPSLVSRGLTEVLAGQVQNITQSQFNSGEVFVTSTEKMVRASNGYEDVLKQSKIYVEVCFSSFGTEESDSQEYVVTRWGVHSDQIDIPEMCKVSNENCNALSRAEKMPTGKFSVLVDSEILAPMFDDVVTQLNLQRKYLSLPFISSGELLVDGSHQHWSLSLDPEIPYGMRTSNYNQWGREQKKLTLISDNRVTNNIVDKQHGSYLDKKPNTSIGNMRVTAKTPRQVDELRKTEGIVVEILQLSGLFTDVNTLTFSSEIRLARVIDNTTGKSFFAKGGNFSGSFKDNTTQIVFSNEQTDQHLMNFRIDGGVSYFGPKWALLNGVSITS